MEYAHARLRTARLCLRQPVSADAPTLAAAIGNYDVARWLGRVPYPYDVGDADRFIEASGAGRDWIIFLGGELVGGISLDFELGYWVARPAWGQGIATEACDAVVDAHFASSGRDVLNSGHFEDNERSARVLIKQGFRYVGNTTVSARALSQTVRSRSMELSREDWQVRRRFRVMTPRLMIRELARQDLSALMRICGREQVARMLFNIPHPWSEDAAKAWIEAALYRGRVGFRAAICRNGAVIGAIGIARMPGPGTITCMYVIHPDHSGNGYATEALSHFLSDVMTRFNIDTIEADHFDDNPASGAVLRHVGFVRHLDSTGKSAARQGRHPVTVYRLNRADLREPDA